MEGTRASKRVKARREIKEEPEDEELRAITPRKRITMEDQQIITASKVSSECEGRDSQPGQNGADDERWMVKNHDEEIEVTMKIKTESEEDWSEDEEGEGEEDDSDPDYDYGDGSFPKGSGSELCKQHSGDVNQNTGEGELSWELRSVPDVKPVPFRFRPSRTPGPSLDMSASWTPLSVFQLFFSTSVIRTIVENTNKNPAWRKEAGGSKKWTPVTVKDFYTFLTTVLYSSLVKLHSHTDYWKHIWLYDLQFPRNYITRDRFKDIRTKLLLCDPEEDQKNERKKGTVAYDKLFKIQPFYTEIMNACKAHFQPYSNVCVHERKVKKNRPLKCGYRLFALADSSTGYTWNLYFHTGKSAATRGQTAGYTAVKNLLPLSTLGSGYTLYTDGLFSSPRLFIELLDKNISCCGILSQRHSEFPQNARNDFPAPQASRGDIRWLRKGKLLFTKWMDTREVAMCSTVHKAFTGQVIRCPVKEGKGWVLKQFSCPDAVADFNRHMIALGKSDCDFSFSVPLNVEWYRILFYHLLDLSVVNSFILYSEAMKLKGDGEYKQLTQKMFREELCKEMLKFARGCEPVVSSSSIVIPSVLCMPVYYVEGNATQGRKKCRLCSMLTPVYCQKCLVALCLTCNRNCFKKWHEGK